MEWFIREVVVGHDLTTDECFKRERREHVETKAAATWLAQPVRLDGMVAYNRAILTMTISVGKLFRTLP